ncbi:ankyrin repeat and SOCS box protein 8 [Amblyraja radiata]|uniref:ankyrin repeat and SOCS box protein 8 n=1 Tax=Amblyraja radiata TaxID=386614 RepID=UPI001403F2BC|nr:ankyrin repeat and SOCS box protein 8 [Amblyraja radiata]XP_032870804.1 ankyrin repeat and SOCS box protein 8 [Amblyraja radiata]XP_032870805.1 ankyrin repeat and SOCS box protein 8 [Amblyraja radiata]XP_032870806.1 ankyrin repeat and SOCS box protein 8 [Amblyraja radiata]
MSDSLRQLMEDVQCKFSLTERLVRAISLRGPPRDSVEELVRRGADVNGSHGTLKPLHCACMMSNTHCVQLLLLNGAQVDGVDGYQRAPLHYAAERAPQCVEALLGWGADPDVRDGNGATPLHWAAFRGRGECVRTLLEGGASVDPRDHQLDTPLGWAASRGDPPILRLLLDYGGDPRIRNRGGRTPVSRGVGALAGGGDRQVCLELLVRAAGVGGEGEDREPPTLKGLCRYVLRHSLSGRRFLPPAIRSLPLPHSMHDYLMLSC